MKAATGSLLAQSATSYATRANAWRGAFTAAHRLALWGVRGRL
jgi:hypothetical protein